MVQVFSQHADDLKTSFETERRKYNELDTENAGWLGVYQKLESQIVDLKDEISRLESRIQDYQRSS